MLQRSTRTCSTCPTRFVVDETKTAKEVWRPTCAVPFISYRNFEFWSQYLATCKCYCSSTRLGRHKNSHTTLFENIMSDVCAAGVASEGNLMVHSFGYRIGCPRGCSCPLSTCPSPFSPTSCGASATRKWRGSV